MKSKYAYCKEWYYEIINSPSSYYLEPFCILNNLYFVGTKDSAIHLLDSGDGLILFDTGYPNMGAHLLQSIWKCGFTPEDIKIILHTHGHFDHFGNTKFLTTITNAKTYMGREDARMLSEYPKLALCDYFGSIPTEFFKPDAELADGDVIALGNAEITAVHTPGHSEGAITYLFAVSDGSGSYQVTLCGGTGFNTLNKTFIEEYGLNYRKQYLQSIERWKGIKTDIYLGNHSPQSHVLEKVESLKHKAGNPFINPREWEDYINKLEADFWQMVEEEG